MAKNIIVSPWMHSPSGRRHLAGIYRFVAEHSRDWDIIPMKKIGGLPLSTLSKLISDGIDGVITVNNTPDDFMQEFITHGIPVIMLDFNHQQADVRIFSDDEAIGCLAAKHLISFGNFRTFGYVPHENGARWSYLRMKGFAETLATHRKKAALKGHKTNLADWLKQLKRPAAVFCASDEIATDVIRTATLNKIRVPRDISILGVDDDSLFCDNTRPTLSSVRPGHEASGYAAAEALDRIFRHKKATDKTIPPQGITDRESIASCIPATALVERACQLVAEHAKDGWDVDRIAERLHTSRRLLSLRFSQIQGQSVHDALISERLKEVERLLKMTRTTIKEITVQAGFGNVNYLKRLFKSRFGVTMKEFRANASSTADTKRK